CSVRAPTRSPRSPPSRPCCPPTSCSPAPPPASAPPPPAPPPTSPSRPSAPRRTRSRAADRRGADAHPRICPGAPRVPTAPTTHPAPPDAVRVRFCPRPTGTPHVGMLRTAVFDWAHARHHGGKLIFRIEGTDAARDSEESYHQLLDAMRWLGIDWDEGVEVGGPHGPYRQSERGEIYQDVIAKLKDAGHVYATFSTA